MPAAVNVELGNVGIPVTSRDQRRRRRAANSMGLVQMDGRAVSAVSTLLVCLDREFVTRFPNMASDTKTAKPLNKGGKSNENILSGFQGLRTEQRLMASKLSELELELNEHKIVIDTLKNVDPKRKCYRMIGGILCERVVEDVIPALVSTKEQLSKIIEVLHEQLEKKGTEINEYKEKHNIRIRGQDELQQPEEEAKESKRNAIVVDPAPLML